MLHPIDQILVDRDKRQRKKLDQKHIEALADSIADIGLLQPIVIQANGRLIAGEHRLEAAKKLGHSEIKIVVFENLPALNQALIEFEENVRRHDMHWTDRARAIVAMANLLRKENPDITEAEISKRLRLSITYVSKMRSLGNILDEPKHADLCECTNAATAYNQLSRRLNRAADSALDTILNTNRNKPAIVSNLDSSSEGGDDADDVEIDLDSDLDISATALVDDNSADEILNNQIEIVETSGYSIKSTNFIEWAAEYSGPRFNLIHCDFPYGINHQSSRQGQSQLTGAYADSESVYWDLMQAFCAHRENFMAASAHIVFWFSMKHYRATLDFFTKHAPEISWSDFPFIWHKSDNSGILPDAQRGPRRIYETALLGVRGDRKIVKPISNVYSGPTQRQKKLHLSEKSEPMLKQLLSMYIDDSTNMLDPTCGGGSAMRAAVFLDANAALGIELNSEFAGVANSTLKDAIRYKNIQNTIATQELSATQSDVE